MIQEEDLTLNIADTRLGDLSVAIVSDAAPSRNGVGSFYVDLSKHLGQHLKRIEILSPTVIDDKWQAGLVLPLPGDKTQKLCFPNPFQLKRQLQEINPQLVLIATPGVYGLVGARIAEQMNVPAIAGFHTSFEKITELYWQNSLAGKIVQGYFNVSNNYLFKKCPLVLANSEEMIQQATRMGAKSTRLITTPVSSTFTDTATSEYSGALKKVLFAGRMAPEKNLDAIVEAAKSLPNIEFTLAGDGPLREEMEAVASHLPNLHCIGWCSRDDIRDQIDQHDALVLPSHFESFGTIALEAMTRKRLVVVSKHCGIVEWQSLLPGLRIMQNDSLSEALRSLSEKTEQERKELAHTAYKVSRDANQVCLNDWFELLLENARLN